MSEKKKETILLSTHLHLLQPTVSAYVPKVHIYSFTPNNAMRGVHVNDLIADQYSGRGSMQKVHVGVCVCWRGAKVYSH